MEVVSGKASVEKEVDWERMTEEEFQNQCNRLGRLVTFNDQIFIGPITYEITAYESVVRYYQQQQRLKKKLKES